MSGRRRRIPRPAPGLAVEGHWQLAARGLLPERPELRLAVELTRLERQSQLDDARMAGPAVDLLQRSFDVVRVDADRATEPLAVGLIVQPPLGQHLVVGREDSGTEMAVGEGPARHRVQDRDVDAALLEQVLADQLRVGAWPAPHLWIGEMPKRIRAGAPVASARGLDLRVVLAVGGPVPVHLHVGDAATLERLAQPVVEFLVPFEEDVNAGVDDHARPLTRPGSAPRAPEASPAARTGPSRSGT